MRRNQPSRQAEPALPTLRDISTARVNGARPAPSPVLRTITAQLSLTDTALARLLSVSGTQSRFILSSTDGSVMVHVGLAIAAVPEGAAMLGQSGVILDWSRGTITCGARRQSLSRTELRFLAVLMECWPRVATREHLASRLWPGGTPPLRNAERERTLSVWTHALRRHFEAIGLPAAIVTVRGVGYRLDV